jgi:hypothetical protein
MCEGFEPQENRRERLVDLVVKIACNALAFLLLRAQL